MTMSEQSPYGLPLSVWNGWRLLYHTAQRYATAKGLLSMLRLRQFKDRHRGERCFIIGNGPSLNQMDLRPLRNEYTFGFNRIYLLFPSLGFGTTYFVSINYHVIQQWAADIAALPMPKFIGWAGRHCLPCDERTMFVRNLMIPHFSRNPSLYLWEGHTVTYVAMQLAYYMGFRQVVLIGVDHHFVTPGTPGALVVSEGEDPNHFAGNYFGPGVRWQLPELDLSERYYRLAREAYRLDGREILDATVGGKLQVFPKVCYESLFSDAAPRPAR